MATVSSKSFFVAPMRTATPQTVTEPPGAVSESPAPVPAQAQVPPRPAAAAQPRIPAPPPKPREPSPVDKLIGEFTAWLKRGNPVARIGIVILFFGAVFLAKYAAENSMFPIELRFSAGDDALLSPAHARESAFVAVHVFEGMSFEAPFREVEAVMGEWGGRPHWGKRSFLSAAELAPRYPRWADFAAIRERLDPDGRFVNAWARQTLL